MKYLVATIFSMFANPLTAHHAKDIPPIQSADQAVTWLFLTALTLGFLAINLRHTLRGSQD
ncbi:hypothetical protein MACH17_09210 [Phaeobacter inhibens]|uniref:hypothetical protein n=1 Tax=Phaeobacter inhibens TaxID=221822 RepID=UPI0027716394|nr:hypothetical protein [Phaeobacter inhibens]GLO69404.1 hypothetical protein MACH17_09210 [Phaeobacter inhibens]